jgi:FMN phosphatase YigB (HAD superfamily)
MIEAGLNATLEQCEQERVLYYKEHSTSEGVFLHLVEKFKGRDTTVSPEDLKNIGLRSFHEKPLEKNIFLYPDAREILSECREKYLTFLVTLGNPDVQRQKVHALHIEHLFTKIFYVDRAQKSGKGEALGMIIGTAGLKPNRCLSIGNRLDLEIAQAKALGMQTCFLQTDRHRSNPVTSDEQPDYKIQQFSEIMSICQL